MNRKLLCRIVSNIFQSFSDKNFLDGEIALLRKNLKTNLLKLDEVMNFHEKIIEKRGVITFKEVIEEFSKIAKNISITEMDFLNLKYFFNKEEKTEIIREVLQIDKLGKYKLLLIEMLINSIEYRTEKGMLLFNPSVIGNFYNSAHGIEDEFKNIINNTFYYSRPKKIFSLDEINQNIRIFYEKYAKNMGVISIFLFGSYAKKCNDEFSDIDIMFIFEKNTFLELYKLLSKDILKKEFKMDCDILSLVDGTKLDEFDEKVLSYGLKII